MVSRFTELVIDSHDPDRLAAFWQEVLGCPTMERGSDGGPYVWIGGGGSPVELVFVPVPETKAVKNRIHIDVSSSDRDQAEEVERLLALGATPMWVKATCHGSSSPIRRATSSAS